MTIAKTMSEKVDRAILAGMASTEEYLIEEHLNYIYEIETSRIQKLLPAGVTPKEPRPGISLLNIGYMKFDATQVGGRPETIELTQSILVNPDLSLDMPVPRMAVYDLKIASNCPVFLAHEDAYQKLNGLHLPGLSRRLRTPGHLDVWDKNGIILEFRNPNPTPLYKYECATGQYLSLHSSGLHQGVFLWEGIGCEQQAEGDCGRLHAHPFFQDFEISRVGKCYLQMFLSSSDVLFYSYHPRRLL